MGTLLPIQRGFQYISKIPDDIEIENSISEENNEIPERF